MNQRDVEQLLNRLEAIYEVAVMWRMLTSLLIVCGFCYGLSLLFVAIWA